MECFTFTQERHVAHLVLNRPAAMNTMGPVFWRELDDVLGRLHREGTARALVISSTGNISAPAWRWKPSAMRS